MFLMICIKGALCNFFKQKDTELLIEKIVLSASMSFRGHMLFTFENNRLVLDEFWLIKDILYNFKAELRIFVMLLSF